VKTLRRPLVIAMTDALAASHPLQLMAMAADAELALPSQRIHIAWTQRLSLR
jgi:hypothetical protein